MSPAICECSGNFLNIMVRGDPSVKEALNIGVAREQSLTRKFSTICELSGNFLIIMINGDPVIKEALTVGVYREQAWTP